MQQHPQQQPATAPRPPGMQYAPRPQFNAAAPRGPGGGFNPLQPPRGSNFPPPPPQNFAPPGNNSNMGFKPANGIPPPNFSLQTPTQVVRPPPSSAPLLRGGGGGGAPPPRSVAAYPPQQQPPPRSQPQNFPQPPRMPTAQPAVLPPGPPGGGGLAPLQLPQQFAAPRGNLSSFPRPGSPMNQPPFPRPGSPMNQPPPPRPNSPMNQQPPRGFNPGPARGPVMVNPPPFRSGLAPPPTASFQPPPSSARSQPFAAGPPRPGSQFQQPPLLPQPSAVAPPPPRLSQQQQQPGQTAQPPSNRPNLDFPPTPVHINSMHYDLPKDSQPFVCGDVGNASYRYMRPTCRYIPTASSKLSELKLPLAILAQPFADPTAPEEHVAVSEWNNESGPVRCSRCRGYINCFAEIGRDNAKWECALCQHVNDLQVNYRGFAQSGNCAELKYGSVEFQVNESFFSANQPAPQLDLLFLVDANQASLRSGLFSYSLHSLAGKIKQCQFPPHARIAIVTYDEVGIHFYLPNVTTNAAALPPSSSSPPPRVLVCGDVDEGFSPLPSDAIMLSPTVQTKQLDELVQFVSGRFTLDPLQANSGSIGGAALASAVSCLKLGGGGRIVWLSAQLPIRGQGKLVERELPAIVGHADKEQQLYVANAEETFYNLTATACLQHNICLDVLACGPQFMDLATLVQITSTTGGTLDRIPGFAASNPLHRQQLDLHLSKLVLGTRAMGINLKARVSTGLTVKRLLGHGFADEQSFKIAVMSNEYCLGIELEHDGTKLNESQRVICQLAVLFTSPQGQRRLRVHNFALTAREQVSPRQFDQVSVANLWGKMSCLALAEKTVTKTREGLIKRLAMGLENGEVRNTLVTYCNSLLKSPALLVNKPLDQRLVREPFAFADARILSRFRLLEMSNDRFQQAMYPTVLDLSNPTSDPIRIPCGSECVKSEGIYLMFDGTRELDVFVGNRANPELVEAYFGASALTANRAVVCCALADRKTLPSQNLLRLCRLLLDGEPITSIRVNFAMHAEFFNEAKQMFPKLMEDKIYTEQALAGFMSYVNQMAVSAKNGG
ncbi:hypothetical protein BASA81_011251 [Batrachochytrium salamandrivorans]|nr:hypothetical protein BASA81_011251 [Batrachochytrium salamandrivorans]